jgi:hypothetical protein
MHAEFQPTYLVLWLLRYAGSVAWLTPDVTLRVDYQLAPSSEVVEVAFCRP